MLQIQGLFYDDEVKLFVIFILISVGFFFFEVLGWQSLPAETLSFIVFLLIEFG